MLSARQLLCVFLIHEKQRGKDSDWYFYINTLPTNYSNVINWSREDLLMLPPDANCKALSLMEEVEKSFEGISRSVDSYH